METRPSVAQTTEWKTYKSPTGFYTVEYPPDWHASLEENIVNIVPPDDSGAITISAFHGEAPIPNFPRTWLLDSFETEKPTSEMKSISRNGWEGFEQEFRGDTVGDDRAWIAIVAEMGPVFVLITANDSVPQMELRREIYECIINSLIIRPPQPGEIHN